MTSDGHIWAQMGSNDDDNGVSNPDGNVLSADGSILSMGGRITSSYADVVSLTNLIKLLSIFCISVYGTTISLSNAYMFTYAEIIAVHRSLRSAHGEMSMMDGSIISVQGIMNIPDREINMKVNFIVSARKRAATPHKRSMPLSDGLQKSHAVKPSAYGKTKGKHDDRCTSPFVIKAYNACC